MASKIRVYTKTGDKGTSTLYNLQRLPKNEEHFEALGDTDELNAHIGVAVACASQIEPSETFPGPLACQLEFVCFKFDAIS